MKVFGLFMALTWLLPIFAGKSEHLEVETIRKAEVVLFGKITAEGTIEIRIIVKSPVDIPPVCKIIPKELSAAAFSKWCRDHSGERTILLCSVDKDNMDLTPQFGSYSFWPQGHDRGRWIQQNGISQGTLEAIVVTEVMEHGKNFMKKSYPPLQSPSKEADK